MFVCEEGDKSRSPNVNLERERKRGREREREKEGERERERERDIIMTVSLTHWSTLISVPPVSYTCLHCLRLQNYHHSNCTAQHTDHQQTFD